MASSCGILSGVVVWWDPQWCDRKVGSSVAWSCDGILSGVVVRWDPQWRGRVVGSSVVWS